MSVRVQGHVTLHIGCLNDATPYIALLCILSAACLLLAVQVTKSWACQSGNEWHLVLHQLQWKVEPGNEIACPSKQTLYLCRH